MSDLVRTSLSIEESLLKKLEDLVAKKDYGNRSEFIRDLIRDRLVQEQWASGDDVVGTITMVFDHHARDLQKKLTHAQHHHHDVVLVTTHLHLSHTICLEVIVARGAAHEVEHLYEHLKQQKGVLHVALSLSTTGDLLA